MSCIPFVAAPGYAHTAAWLAALQAVMPEHQIVAIEALSACEKSACKVAIVANPDPEQLRQLPQLEWVHSVWAGVERLVAELTGSEVKVVRLVDPQLSSTMAEAVLTWVLYLHRDIPRYARQQAAKQWQAQAYVRPQQKTISLLGLGALGAAAAQRLLQAGFNVQAWSQSLKSVAGIACYSGEHGLAEMVAKTDILVCLLPLTEKTKGLINKDLLSKLPANAALINFARGAIVNDADLQSALDRGHLSHAVLDVFTVEPLAESAWQWQHPQVTVLPHCSAPTDRETAAVIVANNIRHFCRSGELPATVDRQRGY